MKAMIFAAGMGTRLKPLTDTLPKALVPVGGKPLLYHVIENLKAAGFSEFVINVHHFAQQIKDYVRENNFFEANISFSDETDMLRETGGGIRHAAVLLNDGEPFLIHNVDILSNLDVAEFYAAHCRSVGACGPDSHEQPLATLLVSDRKTERYLLFDAEDNLVAWINLKTGEVKSPFAELRREPSGVSVEMPEGRQENFDHEAFLKEYGLRKFAFAGIHVLSPEVFRLMGDKPDKFSIITFYLSYCHKYKIKAHIVENLKLVDVGKLDSLHLAEQMVAEL